MKPKGKTKHDAVKVEDNQKYFVAINQELKAIRTEMATKKELEMLRTEMATKKELEMLRTEMATKKELEMLRTEMATKKELRNMEERIFQHFDVAVEEIESSLRGANADQLSLLEDGKKDHEVRITNLEVRAGLRAK